jgi:hypothetical protein
LKVGCDKIFLASDLIFIVFVLLIGLITGGLRRTAPLTEILARKDTWLDI